MRKCKTCKQMKDDREFLRSQINPKLSTRANCKKCHSKYMVKYRQTKVQDESYSSALFKDTYDAGAHNRLNRIWKAHRHTVIPIPMQFRNELIREAYAI